MTIWTLDAELPTLDAAVTKATLDGFYNVASPPQSAPPYTPYVPGAEFVWIPSYESPKNIAFKLRDAAFGDGYRQRSGVGINNIQRQWDLRFDDVSENTAIDIQTFLEARSSGTSFIWVPTFLNPNNSIYRVICIKISIVPASYQCYNIAATFEQVYGE